MTCHFNAIKDDMGFKSLPQSRILPVRGFLHMGIVSRRRFLLQIGCRGSVKHRIIRSLQYAVECKNYLPRHAAPIPEITLISFDRTEPGSGRSREKSSSEGGCGEFLNFSLVDIE